MHKCLLCINNPEGVLGLKFAENAPLAAQSPYPIIVYSVANYRPHLSHFWANTKRSENVRPHSLTSNSIENATPL